MTWAPAKKDTLEAISAEILHSYRRGRFMIAVDGIEGSGTREFADELADALRAVATTKDGGAVEVVRASASDFPGGDAGRDVGASTDTGLTAADVYRDAVDVPAVRAQLVEPFRSGAAAVGALRPSDPESALSADAVLVVDGVFLLRPELRGAWNFSLWLNVPRELADARVGGEAVAADGPASSTPDAPDALTLARRGARDLYWSEAEPRTTATAIVDNTDLEHPRRVFADSC